MQTKVVIYYRESEMSKIANTKKRPTKSKTDVHNNNKMITN